MTRVALITGAGTGIGRATALALAARHYAVALVGRTLTTLQQVAAEIQQADGTAAPFVADVSQPKAVEQLVRAVIDRWGRIDVAVNNAGMAPAIPLAQMTIEQWHDVLQSNLSSTFYVTRAVWPAMERQHATAQSDATGPPGSIIVNISSRASRDPFPGLGAYAAAKSAINMLTLVTAREGESAGIRAICIAPGAVDTEMLRKLVGDDHVTPESAMQPADIASVIVDAIEGSLRYISGETIFLHRKPA